MKLLTALACVAMSAQLLAIDIYRPEEMNEELLIQFSEGNMEDTCLEIDAGHFHMVSDISVSLLNTCYVRIEDEEVLFSSDTITWLPFMEYFTGSFKVEFDPSSDPKEIEVFVDVSQREI